MSYCLNLNCPAPAKNSSDNNFCLSCGAKILLKDRYRAQQLLGEGGFGRTFKAVDEDQPRKPLCVIKQFSFHHENPKYRQKALELFYEEARHLESLGKHEQIPELLAYFDIDGQPYLIQQFIDGQDLDRELEISGAFNQSQIRELLLSLLPVLDFIHNQSPPIIHRDIKPANIIRRRSDGELILVDFGAAKQATQTMLAKTATVIGSPEYTSPEQARGKPTFASDIYSLGVTCIFLLTQVSPFDLFDLSEDNWAWRDYLVDNPVDRQLGEVLDKSIANSLTQRYRSAKSVLAGLEQNSKSVTKPNYATVYQLAETAYLDGNYQQAAMIIDDLVLKFDTDPSIRLLRGHIYCYGLEKHEIGKKEYEYLAKLSTDSKLIEIAHNGWKYADSCLRYLESPTATSPATLSPVASTQSIPKQPALQAFGFETAKVSHGKAFWGGTKVIVKKSPGRANRFFQNLGGSIGLQMVSIPGGTFLMGAPNLEEGSSDYQRPQHRVSVPSFYMGKYPVTQAQYQAIMGDNPSYFQGGDRPVDTVSWHDAVAFCQKLSQRTQRQYRLPSEAEWEYACRSGTTTPFYFGDTIDPEVVNYRGEETTVVGIFPANSYGLYDMHGNILEWCADKYHGNYIGAPTDGSVWHNDSNGTYILRGGSWYSKSSYCRSAFRTYYTPDCRFPYFGFRVCLSLSTI
jgi:eukaryotic-like serine/threonine-protein kinase